VHRYVGATAFLSLLLTLAACRQGSAQTTRASQAVGSARLDSQKSSGQQALAAPVRAADSTADTSAAVTGASKESEATVAASNADAVPQPRARKCASNKIVVQVLQKLGPKEYSAWMIGWNGRPMALIVVRTEAEERFQGNEKGWISICSKGHKEKYEMQNGFSREVWVYQEAPAKTKRN